MEYPSSLIWIFQKNGLRSYCNFSIQAVYRASMRKPFLYVLLYILSQIVQTYQLNPIYLYNEMISRIELEQKSIFNLCRDDVLYLRHIDDCCFFLLIDNDDKTHESHTFSFENRCGRFSIISFVIFFSSIIFGATDSKNHFNAPADFPLPPLTMCKGNSEKSCRS